MRRILLTLAAGMAFTAAPAVADVPVTLRGSKASMSRQHTVAKVQGYAFAATAAEVARLESAGELVRIEGNDDYELNGRLSAPVARLEMRLFLERLGAGYRAACGEKLVVTSLTRPASRQPGNAHALSVHPAGMAVDLRVSRSAACRSWLEGELLGLEREDLLDVTRENRPPHYHVALFPEAYAEHAEPLIALEETASLVVAARWPRQAMMSADAEVALPSETHRGELPGRGLLPLVLVAGLLVRLRSGVAAFFKSGARAPSRAAAQPPSLSSRAAS